MSHVYYFVIVGTDDTPLYESELGLQFKDTAPSAKKEEARYLNQFVAHAALDIIDEAVCATNDLYLRTVDKYNELNVSCYVTPSNIRFILLHDNKADDSIRQFFIECHELYIKILCNPFYMINTPITSAPFDIRVKSLARRHLL
ncbi:TRAPP subunit [Tieghemiomyces parasiticus]|uniref:Trafficking protein particle complex subunit n=1 Tax=Tieghemiomyces parasiticus TaxID=78921 RepID=A0A9W8E1K0_9FUNG|nr:TRAPP subunit [Tieghemiomyces parasiticus]